MQIDDVKEKRQKQFHCGPLPLLVPSKPALWKLWKLHGHPSLVFPSICSMAALLV